MAGYLGDESALELVTQVAGCVQTIHHPPLELDDVALGAWLRDACREAVESAASDDRVKR